MKSWFKSALLGAFLVSVSAGTAYAGYHAYLFADAHIPHKITIKYNPGGLTQKFLADYSTGRRRGDTYDIDDFCESACTYIFSQIPLDHVCITPFARMGFHAAFWIDGKEVRHFAPDATMEMWIGFPPAVKAFLKKHGWSGPEKDQENMIFMTFDDLKAVFRVCGPKE